MKVNPSAGFEQYKTYINGLKNSDPATPKVKGEGQSSAAAQNTDKVTLSESAAAQAEISRLASSVAAEVENTGNDARLAQLSEQVAGGRYFVDTDALVSSIIGEA